MTARLCGESLCVDTLEEVVEADASLFIPIADFEVRFRDGGARFGNHVELHSAQGGRLAGFPFWDHAEADLRDMTVSGIPVGTVDAPFRDIDQGWHILIWERGKEVFVLEGDSRSELRFEIHFRVPADTYREKWSLAIAAARSSPGAFKSVKAALRQPHLARTLLLGNKRLATLPHGMAWLKNVEFLCLYNNRLTTLPGNIDALERLRWIDLRFNRIQSLPESMGNLRYLESLNLAENQLRDIPEWAYELPNLKVFFVPSNPIPESVLNRFRQARPDVEVTHSTLIKRQS